MTYTKRSADSMTGGTKERIQKSILTLTGGKSDAEKDFYHTFGSVRTGCDLITTLRDRFFHHEEIARFAGIRGDSGFFKVLPKNRFFKLY